MIYENEDFNTRITKPRVLAEHTIVIPKFPPYFRSIRKIFEKRKNI